VEGLGLSYGHVRSLERPVYLFQAILQVPYDCKIVLVLRGQLGFILLLACHLLLFKLLHFHFELVEMELALLLCSEQFLPMELLQVFVLFNSLLKSLLVLGCDFNDLCVQSFNFLLMYLRGLVVHLDLSYKFARVSCVPSGPGKQLHGTLSEVLYLAVVRFFLETVQLVDVRTAFFIGMRLEQIVRHLSTVVLLQVAKNKINPLGKHCTCIIRLKSLSHFQHEIKR
jgi:hypothetical protein